MDSTRKKLHFKIHNESSRKRSEEGSQEGDINSISRLVVPFLHFLNPLSFALGWEETG